ncbi:MAG: biotin/lipoate A/B protein ligase family protein [Cyanobacteriota bacterium]|nr:biotin/lipoate A/B protein ligase family protein [Cyanobacteriota bacterium]
MSNNHSVWRFIPFIKASGQIQMAIDAWLLEQHRQGKYPPTLRFYAWEPVAISLGYHQRRWPDSWHHLTWRGEPIDLVRRPTGGRAVLHQGDLTYAVVTSGLSQHRLEAYRTICQFLIEGWRKLGFELNYGSAGRGYIHNSNCFETATGADLVLPDGFKLIGSAQLRREQTILQHGSIRLEPDPELHQLVFGKGFYPSMIERFSGESEGEAQTQSSQVQKLVMRSLIEAACQCFNIEFKLEPLSYYEWQAIQAYSVKFSVL